MYQIIVIFVIKDYIVLKKINIPDLKKEFERLVDYGRQHAKKLGIKSEKDVVRMIHEARGIKIVTPKGFLFTP